MASLWYPKAKEALLKADIDLENDTIKAVFVDTADYTYNAAHDFLDDVAGGSIVGTAQTLGSKTFTNGVFDAADSTFTAVTGDPVEAIIIYKDTGVAATSNLIIYIDGLTTTPNGGNLTISWHASGIAAL